MDRSGVFNVFCVYNYGYWATLYKWKSYMQDGIVIISFL